MIYLSTHQWLYYMPSPDRSQSNVNHSITVCQCSASKSLLTHRLFSGQLPSPPIIQPIRRGQHLNREAAGDVRAVLQLPATGLRIRDSEEDPLCGVTHFLAAPISPVFPIRDAARPELETQNNRRANFAGSTHRSICQSQC